MVRSGSLSSISVLHVTPYYEWAWAYGGIPRVVSDQVRGLAQGGHRITVATTDACDAQRRHPDHAPTALDGSAGERILVSRNLSNALAYRFQFFVPRRFADSLNQAIGSVQVAHLHGFHHLPGVIAARRLRARSVPYVLQPNGTLPRIERRRAAKLVFDVVLGNAVARHAAVFVAVTNVERLQLEGRGIAGDRIAVVPNPVDTTMAPSVAGMRAQRERWGFGDAPVAIYLGQLSPRKGVDHLIRALPLVADGSLKLVVAGSDMGMRPRLERLVENLDLRDRVRFVGVVPGQERLDALGAADVAAYPSREEIFGLVPLEAILCGTPVVVCDDSGCGEVVTRVGGGHVVPHGDPSALASALERRLPDTVLAEARNRIRRFAGRSAVAAALEAVYRPLIERRT
jgi:glycosyltransferase involved in cell wall biosynthesis